MGVKRFAIFFTSELYEDVAADAGEEGISAWLADAAKTKLRRKAALKALNAYESDHGEIADVEESAVKDTWFK